MLTPIIKVGQLYNVTLHSEQFVNKSSYALVLITRIDSIEGVIHVRWISHPEKHKGMLWECCERSEIIKFLEGKEWQLITHENP